MLDTDDKREKYESLTSGHVFSLFDHRPRKRAREVGEHGSDTDKGESDAENEHHDKSGPTPAVPSAGRRYKRMKRS